MTQKDWIKAITSETKGIDTYKKEFKDVISTLAILLEERDKAYDRYIASGGEPIVETKKKDGSTVMTKNPYLLLWTELNKDALQFWRDLGLTPNGLKKIKDVAPATDNKTSVSEIMQKIRQETK